MKSVHNGSKWCKHQRKRSWSEWLSLSMIVCENKTVQRERLLKTPIHSLPTKLYSRLLFHILPHMLHVRRKKYRAQERRKRKRKKNIMRYQHHSFACFLAYFILYKYFTPPFVFPFLPLSAAFLIHRKMMIMDFFFLHTHEFAESTYFKTIPLDVVF